ncbi:MAG: hypothetical protein QOG21_1223, partial [Actinomycetota bacterium]|nr:hypothetical protein [Actinomycetota bacterium]
QAVWNGRIADVGSVTDDAKQAWFRCGHLVRRQRTIFGHAY